MIRNQNWYDLNESRLWPFDDQARLIDDDGLRLPHDMLADLYIRYPKSLGERLFLSTFTAGPGIVTMTLLGSSSTLSPVAAISLPRPVDIGRMYEVEPMAAGVGGWIVFGAGVKGQESISFRFSDPLQTTLLAQTARGYIALPSLGLGKLYGSESLTGVVRIRGGTDVITVVEEREIGGVIRDVIVVKLAEKLDIEEPRNLRELYAGDCGRRPESGNCGGPDPVEGINTVTPDCCGNIFVELRGCGEIKSIAGECGVIVDCGFGLGEACITPDRLPDSEGRLPNEYDNLCTDYDESPATPGTSEEAAGDFEPTTRSSLPGYPYFENFDDLNSNDLTVFLGNFVLTRAGNGSGLISSVTNSGGSALFAFVLPVPYSLPLNFEAKFNSGSAYNVSQTVVNVISSAAVVTGAAYVSDGAGGLWRELSAAGEGRGGNAFEAQEDRRNIVLWNEGLPAAAGWDCLFKRVETVLSVQPGAIAGKNNGGLVFNYVDSSNYWLAEVDMDLEKSLRVVQLDAGQWKIRGAIRLAGLAQSHRYELAVSIFPLDGSGTAGICDIVLRGLDDNVNAALLEVVLPGLMPGSGLFGFHSDRSLTWFEYLYVDNNNP